MADTEQAKAAVNTDESTTQTSSPQPTTPTANDDASSTATTSSLPPLSPTEFKIYNRLAEQMKYFVSLFIFCHTFVCFTLFPHILISHFPFLPLQHDHFVGMWTILYTACVNSRRPQNMSLKQFLDEGLRLVRYLESHHSIEETHLYPILAKKMPQFKAGKSNKLLRQHELIHEGMDQLHEYILMCKSREVDLELSVLKEKMDTWGEVLMKHLDDEVKELEAETMRKYWTLEEMRAIPI
ncbi:uncharacterized protein PODANS_7_11420 [Podospora anserina S mat+]|uniref:Podospora anserina S mat+ genomic DNA chromosome 7, supercontig 1 n=1 Tax=Podospora anserina (strain S / ATCC MYA-4624 / DSM 980 / FGSC 10383) TaxID=515849 RepID=B2AXR2_PODAN|nr:uncharacterized protein PODANS_7_11420 [Podospora anserina S mat+]CAP69186.1 unnamed protein product [Podospora anserina S mat+]CDP32667.1 Putative protein of unknown function [Podospora anserina S mat+]